MPRPKVWRDIFRRQAWADGREVAGGSPEFTNASISTSAASDVDEEAYGLKLLSEGSDATVDIVAVHGLDGHRLNSWKSKNGRIWLRDLLPARIPNARIFTWGYDANTHSTSVTSVQHIHDYATSLINDLDLERRLSKTARRPIIFLAHGSGGLVVKNALIQSNLLQPGHLEHKRAIKLSTYGIIFFGTPHQGGGGVALGKAVLNMARLFVHTNTKNLEKLQHDSEFLSQQLDQYASISSDFNTVFAYEIYPTPLPYGGHLLVVPKSSAVVPGARNAEAIAVHANHADMIRFSSSEANDFKNIAGHLQIMVEEAQSTIRGNWQWEDAIQNVTSRPDPSPLPGSSEPQAVSDVEACIEWLMSPEDASMNHVPSPHPGTLEWITELPVFTHWLEMNNGIFWVQGKVRSGKSVLMKYLRLQNLAQGESHLCQAVAPPNTLFFSGHGLDPSQALDKFIKDSIITMLRVHPELFQHGRKAFDMRDASIESLSALLKSLVKSCCAKRRLALMIDAVDEFEESVQPLSRLLRELLNTSRNMDHRLTVCVSGRPTTRLQSAFGDCPRLVLEHYNAADMSLYLRSKLSDLFDRANSEPGAEFDTYMVKEARGIFSALAIEEFLDDWEDAPDVAEDRLLNPPRGLRPVYDKMLQCIPTKKREHGKSIMSCVIDALCHLTVFAVLLLLA